LHVVHEISDQCLIVAEPIQFLAVSIMPVIALADLVVVADDALPWPPIK